MKSQADRDTLDNEGDQQSRDQRAVRTKLLFICSRNKQRSLTAEHMYRGFHYDVRSAGTERGARIKVTDGHIGWADWIFVMEKKHLQALRSKYAQEMQDKQVVCLHIPDDYEYMDDALLGILSERLANYVEVPE